VEPRDEHLFPTRRRPASFWERSGLSPRAQRVVDVLLVVLVCLFAGGWTAAIAITVDEDLPSGFGTRLTGAPLARDGAPSAAFALDAALRGLTGPADWRGESGAIRARILEPGDTVQLADTLPQGVGVELVPHGGGATAPTGSGSAAADTSAPPEPGVWDVVLRARDAVRRVPNTSVLVPVPMSEKRGGRIGQYLLGSWPFEGGGAARPGYETPSGLIAVRQQDVDLQVSEHFVLGDFLTKGQQDVWPKYIALDPRNLDKMELTIQELERMGHPVENIGVISGFRHPHYNEGGGDPSGRGSLSRHMYGDAADIFIDNDDDFCMDDLDGDGDADLQDVDILATAAEQVERQYPSLIGGVGRYRPNPGAHCGFVHIDTRGYRARW